MATLEQLTNRVEALLHGYSLNTESATWITSAITTATTTSIAVDDASVVSRGFIQVNDEIMYVASTNNIDNILTHPRICCHRWLAYICWIDGVE